LGGHFGVVLFYRGAWCPYCNAQLRAFQRAHEQLTERNIDVVALSVDDLDTTRELVAKHGLTFPVGHSADAHAIAEATGAFVNNDPVYLQSTGFVLGPDGRVIVSRAGRSAGSSPMTSSVSCAISPSMQQPPASSCRRPGL
jgi:peroxiredoxin